MKYNNNKGLSASKKSLYVRIGAVVLVIVVAVILWSILTPAVRTVAGNLKTNELIAGITLFISLATIVFKISERILKRSFSAKRRISLEANADGEHAVITCRIENCGTKRIVPQNIYLMIEQGVEEDCIGCFPYLLKHEKDEFDCVFANLCKSGGFTNLPDHLLEPQYKNLFRRIIKMKHLSSETILFVDPGEEFSEDVVVKLNKGIYRATVVWTSVKEDCICATKEFIVS